MLSCTLVLNALSRESWPLQDCPIAETIMTVARPLLGVGFVAVCGGLVRVRVVWPVGLVVHWVGGRLAVVAGAEGVAVAGVAVLVNVAVLVVAEGDLVVVGTVIHA